jgi:hypothetical protein
MNIYHLPPELAKWDQTWATLTFCGGAYELDSLSGRSYRFHVYSVTSNPIRLKAEIWQTPLGIGYHEYHDLASITHEPAIRECLQLLRGIDGYVPAEGEGRRI